MKISEVLNTMVTVAKDDVAQKLAPALATFFTSLAANPSQINMVAALAQLQVSAIAVLPTIEQDEFKALAGIFNAQAAALLAPKAS